ncbi:hypothetical protein Naga_100133g15 [Nannochloropsis gaditana]|uniref:Nascent polypeptide-associated complex subunit alpha-like UBA domain-containing protein n=1 Tax=Nannochloropsis gaditana TaxID=72520 RepID=W7TZD1_9STRA|nr:hypothetical protein Naga_100133g15 [Nannochloropsis gaditana]
MATKAQQKENLEKVTDYVEESVLDADRMAKAMSSLESDKSGARAAAAKLARTAYDESAYYLSFLKETAIHTIDLSWSRQLFIHQPRLDSGTLHILYLKSFPIKRGSQISSFLKRFSSELEVTSEAAEQALKESGGDVVKALQRLLP